MKRAAPATPPKPDGPDPVFWSVSEAAKRLGIGQRTAYDLVYAGELPRVEIGVPTSKRKAIRIPVAAVEAYAQKLIDAASGTARAAS